jgi:hypothetical protein
MGYSSDILAWSPAGWATVLPPSTMTLKYYFRWGAVCSCGMGCTGRGVVVGN